MVNSRQLPHDQIEQLGRTKSGDYNGEMDGEQFETWFDFVLTKLRQWNVVMDNASYHFSRLETVPTMSSRKPDILAWLISKVIPCDATMTKEQLPELVAPVKDQFVKFRVDVLRCPHCRRRTRI